MLAPLNVAARVGSLSGLFFRGFEPVHEAPIASPRTCPCPRHALVSALALSTLSLSIYGRDSDTHRVLGRNLDAQAPQKWRIVARKPRQRPDPARKRRAHPDPVRQANSTNKRDRSGNGSGPSNYLPIATARTLKCSLRVNAIEADVRVGEEPVSEVCPRGRISRHLVAVLLVRHIVRGNGLLIGSGIAGKGIAER